MYLKYLLVAVFCSFSLTLESADPSATVTAVDAIANETAGNTGTFRIAFSASKTSATTVAYTIASDSTAINGTDYTNLTGTVVMPANSTTVDILVTPVNDVLAEGSQTVRIILAAATGYTIGNPNTATVTIEDNEVQSVVLSSSTISLREGQSDTVTAQLAFQPEVEMSIVDLIRENGTGVGQGGSAGISLTTLIYTPSNWNTGQSLTVFSAGDLNSDTDETLIRFTGAGIVTTTLTVTVVDSAVSAEKLSVLTLPEQFNAVQFQNDANYRKEYLSKVIPNRVHATAEPGEFVPVLKGEGALRFEYVAGTGGILAVVGAPNSPVTFFCPDGGLIRQNFKNCITIQADALGRAAIHFHPQRPGSRATIIVGSPLSSGQVKFVVNSISQP